MQLKRGLSSLAAVAALLLAAGEADAQGYPTKSIRLIAPSTPGDARDVIAVGGAPDEFAAVMARDIAKWTTLAKSVGIKID